ncbi:MAG TPA: DUF2207 domain-containing protein [Thermotogota bacterium]|nr:DUF2207 domain-containing protein [Thermotogota bacterium]HPJ89343.1 DUF2207 domain-containing protein [Thermotogota bacterium]HPR96511.1 DUF2207 domain-containing protein [Thermotogota bacterium]
MKNIGRVIAAIVVGIILFFVVQFVAGEIMERGSYLSYFLSSKYAIESARVEQTLQEDGLVKVHEIYHYKMRKPFRGLTRTIPQGRYVQMSNVKIWVDEEPEAHVEYLSKTNTSFNARIWIAPYNSYQEIDPEGKEYTLHVTYDAAGVVEAGKDCSQILRQYWGDMWEAPLKDMTAIFNFPLGFMPTDVYTHPGIAYTLKGQSYVFNVSSLPPNAYGEVRFEFDQRAAISEMKYAVVNSSLTQEDIEKEESSYRMTRLIRLIVPPVVFAGLLILIFVIFRYFGKEPTITYEGVYERELPSRDSPDIVNSAVINIVGNVDNDGMSAVMMNLYRKDYIEFVDGMVKNKPKTDTIRFKKQEAGSDLSPSEAYFFDFLKGYADESVLDFKELEKYLRKKESRAKQFNQKYDTYQSLVKDTVRARKYFNTTGYAFAVLIAIVMGLCGLGLIPFMTMSPTPDLLGWALVYSGFFLVTGAIILFLPKDVFGKWSEEGLTYYRKWMNFKKFLEEISMIKQYPPESIILWEEYLVYATALGCADTVEKALKEIVPREQWERQSNHGMMYGAYGYMLGSNMRAVRNVAVQTVSSSSAKGFSGGVGGAGGGSGGGGGGAF